MYMSLLRTLVERERKREKGCVWTAGTGVCLCVSSVTIGVHVTEDTD